MTPEEIEQAAPEQQVRVLTYLADYLSRAKQLSYGRHVKFLGYRDAGAFLDAALMLVPDGWSLSLGERRGMPDHLLWNAWLHNHNTPDGIAQECREGSASAPALALAAAIARSMRP